MKRVFKNSREVIFISMLTILAASCQKSTERKTETTTNGDPEPKIENTTRTVFGPDPYATLATKNFRSMRASLESSLQIPTEYGNNSASSFLSAFENFKYVLAENNSVDGLVSVSNIQMGTQACYTAVYRDFQMADVNARIHIPPEIAVGALYSDEQILKVAENFTLALLGRLPTEEEKAIFLEETKAFQTLESTNAGKRGRETGVFICSVIASSLEFLKQ